MTIAREEPAPRAHHGGVGVSEHVVQFYETDDFLIDALALFVGDELSAGDTCLIIATPAHREHIEQRLRASGLDLAAAQARGHYASHDAAGTLARFMVDGAPDRERFTKIIGDMIARSASAEHPVRVFGEMVALLWAQGNHSAAIRLEALWNELRAVAHPFSLHCAYPMRDFAGEAYSAQLDEICGLHSRVIPDERYTALTSPDEQFRAITLLQQKATSLEAEIAERMQAESRLRISENRYRRLFEASTDGILIVDDSDRGIITDANPGMTRLLGYSHEQLIGRELWQIGLFPDREAALALLRELRERRVVHYDSLRLEARDGRHRYVELASSRFRANGHDVIQMNLRDITDRKLAEEALRASDERKNAFISMASHELKTPVTSLKGFTQILQRRLKGRVDSQSLLFLDRMDAQLKKLASLISDLLDISKMQTGALAFRESSVDLDELVRETVENLQAATTTHHITIQGATHARVFGDRDRLEQVLINLLTNAVKYSPQADTIIVRLSSAHQQVTVAVRDFGIGVAPEHHERIFERFYQVTGPRESTYPGLGIGLYIARVIIERHGGRLWLESRPGAGSTFQFTLPVLSADQATPAPSVRTEEESIS